MLRRIKRSCRIFRKSGLRIYLFSAVLLPVLLAVPFYLHFLKTPRGNGKVVKVVEFSPGSSTRKISEKLAQSNIISSGWLFMLHARLEQADGKLKAGIYRFNDAMTPPEILQKLVAGDVYEVKFTVPEGYSMYQIAELLENRGIFKKEVFLQQCVNPALLNEARISAASVEGHLYPCTYALRPSMDETALLRQMITRFNTVYNRKFISRTRELGVSISQVLTLASMIEKEAVVPEERAIIASVFHNRLQKNMPLQSDPTAVYGVRAFAGRITKRDILKDTPYNTYRIKGLPPGPIGNPGDAAIEAVLSPARTRYLYFVAKKDGTHHFSETLEEHNRAVQLYLRTPAETRYLSDAPKTDLRSDSPRLLSEKDTGSPASESGDRKGL